MQSKLVKISGKYTMIFFKKENLFSCLNCLNLVLDSIFSIDANDIFLFLFYSWLNNNRKLLYCFYRMFIHEKTEFPKNISKKCISFNSFFRSYKYVAVFFSWISVCIVQRKYLRAWTEFDRLEDITSFL